VAGPELTETPLTMPNTITAATIDLAAYFFDGLDFNWQNIARNARRMDNKF
jgi:hypothetical protein